MTEIDQKRRRGSALIVVLCMVVLLSTLILAFFSKTVLEHQISNSSSSQVKVDHLAQGAVDQIVGDLKQEIFDGSSVASFTPSTGGPASLASPAAVYTNAVGMVRSIYRPSVPANALPALQGPYSPTVWNGSLLNLVKQSTHNQPFHPSTGYSSPLPGRAAPLSTSSEPARQASGSEDGLSQNGRVVKAVRWNKALLLPKASANFNTTANGTTVSDTGLDITPSTDFIVPDWILLSRDGKNPTAWNTNLKAGSNAETVIGRYAYTIYNQGALLDANVAGGPSVSSMSAAEQIRWRRKGSAAFADLTLLPGIANVTAVTPQALVNQLVGWRNNATLNPTGTFPNYTLPGNAATAYMDYLLSLSTQFMTSGNTLLSTSSNQSNQIFSSRQQMIAFFQSLAGSDQDKAYLQDALLYFTHFSRTLNQPSSWPDPKRPTVVSAAAVNSSGGYAGGNSAYRKDNIYNPPLKSFRATTAFTRADGSRAVVGEPLVKKRFALSRLAWLTYDGPSNTAGSGARQAYLDSGVSAAFLDQGTAANIQKYFGLTWIPGPSGSGKPGGYWYYDHGLNLLGTMDLIAPANREPDFFELLQAAVHVGAIGKGGGTIGSSNFTIVQDTNLTPQIMQLGANIIDGANPTQYPTHIVYGIGGSVYRSAYGAMDLPYLVDVQNVRFILKAANPAPLDPVTLTPTNFPQGRSTAILSSVSNGLYSEEEGTGALLLVPSIWNLHDVNGPAPLSGYAPTRLRIVVSNPLTTINSGFSPPGSGSWPSPGPWQLGSAFYPYKTVPKAYYTTSSSKPKPPGSSGTLVTNSTTIYTVTHPATILNNWTSESSNALTFSNTSSLYREPTALMQTSTPAGLQMDPNHVIRTTNSSWANGLPDADSGKSFIGFLAATYPLRWTVASTPTNPVTPGMPPYYVYTVNQLEPGTVPASGVTVRLEYQPPSTSDWIPYMEYFCNFQYLHDFVPVAEDGSAAFPYLVSPNTGSNSTGSLWNQNRNGSLGGGLNGSMTTWDPRSQSFGYPVDVGGPRAFIDGSGNGPSTYMVQTQMPTGISNTATGSHSSGLSMVNSGFYEPTGGVVMGLKQMNIWSSPGSLRSDYYADADGTVRRAMAGYLENTSNMVGNIAGTVSNWTYTAKDPASGVATSLGLPLASTKSYSAAVSGSAYTPAANQSRSRPIMLHRPYRSVSELGYVFSGTPWKNIDFFTPESGFSALLDVFCIQADDRLDAVVAGQVDLNGKQVPVFQALLAGAYREEIDTAPAPLINTEAVSIARALVARTTSTATDKGPLGNITDLVGRWGGGTLGTMASPIAGSTAYVGFSGDLTNLYTSGISPGNNSIQRYRETAMRALSDVGQAGTWNLMIDVIAQTGRYPGNATKLGDFLVEGERHYWVHLSIDRSTGEIIDKSIEPVNE